MVDDRRQPQKESELKSGMDIKRGKTEDREEQRLPQRPQ